ncbi:hypothetical protein MXB_1471, partial [Myxobolus squamalis]
DLVEVIAEKIDGCNSCTKECVFEKNVPIKTIITLKAKNGVKLFKKRIALMDNIYGIVHYYELDFCDSPGKDKCKVQHTCIEQLYCQFTLDRKFTIMSGQLEMEIFSKNGKSMYSSTAIFSLLIYRPGKSS